MVEGTGLENRRTGNGTVSSNLTLSVKEQSGIRIPTDRIRELRDPESGLLFFGRVAEWFKAHAWKVCLRETVTWVRIPPRPLTDPSSSPLTHYW